jgi:uncharacterized membrane protein YjfL (UPF0719 family)
MQALYSLPASVLLVLALVVAVALACGGQLLLHHVVKDSSFLDDNDLTGYISGVVVTLYAVLIGFVTVVVWEQYNTTRDRAAAEASYAASVWHDAVGLDPGARSAVRKDMLAYVNLMIDAEWPQMRSGGFSPRGGALIMDATTRVGTMKADDNTKSNAQAATLQLLNGLHTERDQRLEASESPAVSGFMWSIMLLGAVVVVIFCYMFGASHRAAHLIMTGSVAAVIASMLVLSFELQFPFRGQLGISPHVWTSLLEHIRDMDAHGSPQMRM